MAKKQESRNSDATSGFILLLMLAFAALYAIFPRFIPVILFSCFGILACLVFLVWSAMRPFRLDTLADAPAGNATLTCRNGHTSRVCVNLDGHESIYHGDLNGIIYLVDGHEVRVNSKIKPERCPECGAE